MTGARKRAPRQLVIEGRRWRRSDPEIPAALHKELVEALMQARRDVAAAKRRADARAVRAARNQVQDAKVALGERGPRWWEPATDAGTAARAHATARSLLRQRGPEKTICPSDVARIVGGNDWRKHMPAVRAALVELVEQGELEIRQKGKVVAPELTRGPIRLALRAARRA